MIKNKTLTGAESALTGLEGSFACIKNNGTDMLYASVKPGITPGADNVLPITAGESAVLTGANGTVYLLGSGSVTTIGSTDGINFFKPSASASGSGADESARAAISAHAADNAIHASAREKAFWNGKAEVSDIPDKLPADGGNADTVGGRSANDFAHRYNPGLDQYLSGRSGDIRALAYLLPVGGYSLNTGLLSSVGLGDLTGFPLSGDIFMIWVPSYWPGGNLYYGMLIMRAYTGGPLYICNIYNSTQYTEWQVLTPSSIA